MRVYSDQALNTLNIEGVSTGPVADFKFENDNGLISAYRIGSQLYDFKGVPYRSVLDAQGRSFSKVSDLMAYLEYLTVPTFPLRFRTEYPVKLTEDIVSIDQTFIQNNIYLVDGGNA